MKVKALLVASGLALLLAGCGETTIEEVESNEASANTTDAKAEETAEPKTYAIGDTVKVNDLEITITKASFTDPAEYSPAENGKVITLEVATNNTGESAFIDNTEFNLYDSEGNQLTSYFGYDEMAISGDINSGKKLAGKLYFDVPESDSYELIYSPSFSFDNAEVTWDIKPE